MGAKGVDHLRRNLSEEQVGKGREKSEAFWDTEEWLCAEKNYILALLNVKAISS